MNTRNHVLPQRPGHGPAAEISVRAFGIDTAGKAFSQNARARNLRGNGALLSGLECSLKTGDIIGVQLEQKKARFRVALVMPEREFEIEMQPGQECPWKTLAGEQSATGVSASQDANRRRSSRHKVDMKLELRDEFTNAPSRVSATDISSYGCYIERIAPFPVGTKMKIELWLQQGKVNTSAVVRACDPGLGMGVEFMSLTVEQRQHLQDYLEKLDHRSFARPLNNRLTN
jgi:hypothetical protein